LGVSDRHYFAWLTEALARFERESGELAAIGASGGGVLWVLAGVRPDPAVRFLQGALGAEGTTTWLDRYARGYPALCPRTSTRSPTSPTKRATCC
jgi:hypothetical protein